MKSLESDPPDEGRLRTASDPEPGRFSTWSWYREVRSWSSSWEGRAAQTETESVGDPVGDYRPRL